MTFLCIHLISEKRKNMVSGNKAQTKPFFFREIHYMFTYIDSNYWSSKVCHKNIGTLEIK